MGGTHTIIGITPRECLDWECGKNEIWREREGCQQIAKIELFLLRSPSRRMSFQDSRNNGDPWKYNPVSDKLLLIHLFHRHV